MKLNLAEKMVRDPETPSLFKVILAFLVDWYLVALFLTFPVYLLRYMHLGTWSLVNQTNDLPNGYIIAAMVIGILLTLIYFVLLPLLPTKKGHRGQTLGKRLFKIKTVRADGTDIRFKDALIRNLFILIVEGSLFPSFLYIREALSSLTTLDIAIFSNAYMVFALVSILISLLNSQRRAGHDLVSGTKIVKCATE
jgi:uncharacterized RDD family membrane protein YckC